MSAPGMGAENKERNIESIYVHSVGDLPPSPHPPPSTSPSGHSAACGVGFGVIARHSLQKNGRSYYCKGRGRAGRKGGGGGGVGGCLNPHRQPMPAPSKSPWCSENWSFSIASLQISYPPIRGSFREFPSDSRRCMEPFEQQVYLLASNRRCGRG